MNLIKMAKVRNNNIKAYQRLFATEDGLAVLKDLGKHCHLTQSTFNGNNLESAFNEGQRAVLLRIFSVIKMQPEKLIEDMLKLEEANNEI